MTAATGIETGEIPPRLRRGGLRALLRSEHGRQRLMPYAFIVPTLLVVALVLAYPLFFLVQISFQRFGLRELIAGQGTWIGLGNYRTMLSSAFFWQVVVRTVLFTLAAAGLTIVFSTLLALLMERTSRSVRLLLSSGLILVWATPQVVAVDIWQWMFDFEFGVLNWLLTHLGIGSFIHHNWFNNPLEGFAVIGVVVIWGAIPFVAITLYAGLMQVPRELGEAAEVDGAGALQVFRNVTVPVLRPLLAIVASLSTIWDFGAFTQFYVMLNERPSRDYYIMGVYSYVQSFGATAYGTGATIAVLTVLILLALTFVYIRYYIRLAVGPLEAR